METRSSFRLQDAHIQENLPRAPVPVKLCSVCKSIDFVAAASRDDELKEGHKHHSSLKNLRNAARKGCQLCQVIVRHGEKAQYRHYDPSIKDEEPQQIFYYTSDLLHPGINAPYLGATKIHFYQKGNAKHKKTGFSFSADL
jgi:hypothetical protein